MTAIQLALVLIYYQFSFLKGLPNEDTLSDCLQTVQNVSCVGRTSRKSYRTFDGTCNNLNPKKLTQGAAFTKLKRYLRARYADNTNYPRGFPGTTPEGIPSAHEVARELFHSIDHSEGNIQETSILFMTWGQFIDHDISLSPHSSPAYCQNPSCSPGNWSAFAYPCFPIHLNRTTGKCTSFTRSKAACRNNTEGLREQVNVISSYIDGSMIYGSDATRAQKLRRLDGSGKLKTGPKRMLPPHESSTDPCRNKTGGCFLAGDVRANENIALTSMHTLWVREHNRIANGLKRVNQLWSGTKIYEEARKIVIAVIQHITYTEFLPLLFKVEPCNGRRCYKRRQDASITNGFANAAYRFGHSLVPNSFPLCDKNFTQISENIPLRRAFFDNSYILKNNIDHILMGLVSNESEAVDMRFSKTLTRKLFIPFGDKGVADLTALNIQRGRDHGIPAYVRWRKFCNLSRVRNWSDLIPLFGRKIVRVFRSVYKKVRNIDLYPAGMAELKVNGNILGPTFQCIIRKQFEALRSGDRFFYTNPGVFTKRQYQEITKVTMKHILCKAIPTLVSLQDDPFLAFNTKRTRSTCDKRHWSNKQSLDINFRLWRQKKARSIVP